MAAESLSADARWRASSASARSAAIFASFSLFVQPNPTVVVALGASALAVAAAVFLIVELNSPFGGLLQISSAPAHAALAALPR